MEIASPCFSDGDFFASLFTIMIEDADKEMEIVTEEIVGGNIPKYNQPLAKRGIPKSRVRGANIVACEVLVGEVLGVGGDMTVAAAG